MDFELEKCTRDIFTLLRASMKRSGQSLNECDWIWLSGSTCLEVCCWRHNRYINFLYRSIISRVWMSVSWLETGISRLETDFSRVETELSWLEMSFSRLETDFHGSKLSFHDSKMTFHGSKWAFHGSIFIFHDSNFSFHDSKFSFHDSKFSIHHSKRSLFRTKSGQQPPSRAAWSVRRLRNLVAGRLGETAVEPYFEVE